jgi:hypothetical protein
MNICEYFNLNSDYNIIINGILLIPFFVYYLFNYIYQTDAKNSFIENIKIINKHNIRNIKNITGISDKNLIISNYLNDHSDDNSSDDEYEEEHEENNKDIINDILINYEYGNEYGSIDSDNIDTDSTNIIEHDYGNDYGSDDSSFSEYFNPDPIKTFLDSNNNINNNTNNIMDFMNEFDNLITKDEYRNWQLIHYLCNNYTPYLIKNCINKHIQFGIPFNEKEKTTGFQPIHILITNSEYDINDVFIYLIECYVTMNYKLNEKTMDDNEILYLIAQYGNEESIIYTLNAYILNNCQIDTKNLFSILNNYQTDIIIYKVIEILKKEH